ncbi:MAG: TENA/THI-4 family protein [Rhodobacterales bacterium]|nr:MAG: TENA/THI-4 family protein [Rhodobacterales bacterium]
MDSATEFLRQQNADLWQQIVAHDFCRQLADGTLPADKMRGYLIQDYKFVGAFVRLLASAIAHAPTLADSVPAAQFLALITGEENTYFLRSFAALNVSEQDQHAPAKPATTGFLQLMEDAIASGRYEQMLAVICVAEWSYLSWATPYHPPQSDLPFWLAEWITLHAGEGFEAVVGYFRQQLDQCWGGLDEAARQSVAETFARAVRLEKQFFDESLQG